MIEEYDEKEKISYKDGTNKYLTKQWLAFQISGIEFSVVITYAQLMIIQDKVPTSAKQHGLLASIKKNFNLPSIAM